MISTEAIAALAVCSAAGILLPVAAVAVFKLKFRRTSLLSAVIGGAAFIVFALVLEQILHLVMLPVVMNSTIAYVIYGTLAAGVFEETGRFIACKFLMKKRSDNANAVMLGLGHGGTEAIILVGFSAVSSLITAIMVNSMGFDLFAKLAGANTPELVELLNAQLQSLQAINIPIVLLTLFERIAAITVHVSLSVIVMKSVYAKGKLWLYPAAVLLHALFDVPAALYQRKVISELWLTELFLAAGAALLAVIAVKVSRLGNMKSTV